jgi:hypothetical protein
VVSGRNLVDSVGQFIAIVSHRLSLLVAGVAAGCRHALRTPRKAQEPFGPAYTTPYDLRAVRASNAVWERFERGEGVAACAGV